MARSPLLRLLSYARRYRLRIALATVCSILNKVFDIAPPMLIGLAVDIVVEREHSLLADLGVVDTLHQLWVLVALTVLIWGLESVFEYLFSILWRNLAQTLQHDLRLDTYAHIQRLDSEWFEERPTGELMAILNDDVNQLERFLDGGANALIQVATTVVVVGGAFAWASPGVAVLAMLPVPIIVLGSFRFQSRIAPRYTEVRERVADLSAQLQNNLTGMSTIKSFTAEDYEVERVRVQSDRYREANGRAITLSSAFSPLIRMAIVVGFTATLLYGGTLTLSGFLSVGTYSVLVFLTQRLLWPLTSLGSTFDLYQRAMASTSRILDLLDTAVRMTPGHKEIEVEGQVVFERVGFAYGDREPVLKDFDLELGRGTTTAIVGPTGAGKTTLVRLLLRLRDPTAGRVTIDGVDLRELDPVALRRQVGLVSQAVFLFPGTVRENIAYGSFEEDHTAIEAAARAAEAHDFIVELPQGYDTLIGERGQKLSGGQRQRIAIARAILKDPRVLILDEATSAVDNETEAAIQRSLDHVSQGRTVLVIAHRLSTIRNADQIIVLDRGVIVERGRHEVLLARGGLYDRLWRIQTGERRRIA